MLASLFAALLLMGVRITAGRDVVLLLSRRKELKENIALLESQLEHETLETYPIHASSIPSSPTAGLMVRHGTGSDTEQNPRPCPLWVQRGRIVGSSTQTSGNRSGNGDRIPPRFPD